MIKIYKPKINYYTAIGNYLPFENNIDDIYGKNWEKTGNPEIKNCSNIIDINGNKLFQTALYLDESSSMTSEINVGGTDFSISFWICPLEKIKNEEYNYIFVINNSENWIIFEYRNSSFLVRSLKNNDSMITSDNQKINTWHHIALCYHYEESKLYIYINGILSIKYEYILNIYKSHSFTIGAHETDKNTCCFHGYLRNLQIYENICRWNGDTINLNDTYYVADLNYSKLEYELIDENNNDIQTKRKIVINYNTKLNNFARFIRKTMKFHYTRTTRLISKNNMIFKYLINRNVEWTRKIISYILDPNIYKETS